MTSQTFSSIGINSSAGQTSALTAAFGTLIGYFGAEAAVKSQFESLLWPQRHYCAPSWRYAIESALLMPMGGPLQRAALEVLDNLRRRGLYLGQTQGHMLDSAFFPDMGLKYALHVGDVEGEMVWVTDGDKQVRNGLWVSVLRRLRSVQRQEPIKAGSNDEEAQVEKLIPVRRSIQRVQHLSLEYENDAKGLEQTPEFSEEHVHSGAVLMVIASELTSLGCAIAVICYEQCYWFAAYLLLPITIRLSALAISVRRESLAPMPSGTTELNLAQIQDNDYGFPLVTGPKPLVHAFFAHYGHPLRSTDRDRWRERGCIMFIILLAINFPFGLLSMLFVRPRIQFLWLSYQLFLTVNMHVSRILGYKGRGRTDVAIARALVKYKCVKFKSGKVVVVARWESDEVESIYEGRSIVRDKMRRLREKLRGKTA